VAVVVRRGGAQDVRFLRDMLHHAYYWKERQPDAGPGPVQLYVKAWGRPGDTAVIALLDGFPHHAALMLFLTSLPALALSRRQTLKHRDLLLTLQLWGLHWLRLHLAGAAFVLSFCHWKARRPARG
jgi:hypothetical protein